MRHLASGVQGLNAAPVRLNRTADSGVHAEGGARSVPSGVPHHQACPEGMGREAYDAGPQNSNGTTMGQVKAAGPQSAQPEGVSLGGYMQLDTILLETGCSYTRLAEYIISQEPDCSVTG